MRTSKEPSECPKGPKIAKWVIFKGDDSLDSLFLRLWEILKLYWTSHTSGYLLEPIRDNEDFPGLVRNVHKGQKQPNR